MKIVICQGSPVVPSKALDSITNRAEFFLAVNIGMHYVRGSETVVILKRHGSVVFERRIPVPLVVPSKGIPRLLVLPFVHIHYLRIMLWAVNRWAEAREACFIARSWLTCIAGLLARSLGKVEKVVYWVGDYYPVAGSYDHRIVNTIYQIIERYIVRHADRVWYIVKSLYDVHALPDGSRMTSAPEDIVTCLYSAYPDVYSLWTPERLHHFMYIGSILKNQGLDVILPAIVEARKFFPDIFLDVVGTGPYEEEVREMAQRLNISDCVKFHGFVQDENRIHQIAARSSAGFALYHPSLVRHAYYTVNSKVFVYIGCGTPVIINKGAGSFDYVMDGKSGVCVEYQVDSIVKGMQTICANVEEHKKYRAAAMKVAAGLEKEAEKLRELITSCALGNESCSR